MDITIEGPQCDSRVVVNLKGREEIFADGGSMVYMTNGVTFSTEARGIMGFFGRALADESAFLNKFHLESHVDRGRIVFAHDFPCDVKEFQVSSHESWRIAPGSFLLCEHGVHISGSLTIKGALLGGTDLFTGTANGHGRMWLGGNGAVELHELAPGQGIVIDKHRFLACDSLEVEMELRLAPGIVSAVFGNEGLWMIYVVNRGHKTGKVWTQTRRPLSYLIREQAGGDNELRGEIVDELRGEIVDELLGGAPKVKSKMEKKTKSPSNVEKKTKSPSNVEKKTKSPPKSKKTKSPPKSKKTKSPPKSKKTKKTKSPKKSKTNAFLRYK